MSPRLPRLTGKEVIAALKRAGFVVVRKSGSHRFLSHPDDPTRYATVAVHSGKNIPAGTLNEILRTARLTPDEFKKLL
ncbi:MAG: type II toxin-antitoxin system HicA family toxin [Desulfotomaculales bacterium]